ncbi:MAG: FIST C-terminal domain-containing protein [Coriobacteriales bacterium]|jgi:hypothetical protein|nr:FIST C-terminal domain-containing protein [Coriobacteriales bacterium]
MLNAQKAFTVEIDDLDAAVAEIQEQLDLDRLESHTIGLISCLPAYVESGVVAALQEALPFDLVGQTSIATATVDGEDLDQLSLLVLSADDAEFSLSLSEPVTGEDTGPLTRAYEEASAHHTEKPRFILGYVPLLFTASGDFFVDATNTISGGVPFFGSLSVDDTMDYHNSQVIFKGEGYSDRTAYILFYGKVRPRFYLAGISHDKIINETGVVTASASSQLQSVNGAPVSVFLKDKGLQTDETGQFVGINTFPYIVDYNDGTDPVIRVMFALTPEGYAICGGDIPVGATLGVSYFDSEEIKKSSKTNIAKIAEDIARDGANAVVVFSCIGRFFNLDFDTDAEALLLRDALKDSGVPYTLTYSGGEICPVPSKHNPDILTNRAHNSTLVAVVL